MKWYGSKIFTEPDLLNKTKNKHDGRIHGKALHNIFLAMKGLRIFERFGFNLPKKERLANELKVINNGTLWEYDINRFDWYNNNGESLTGYLPNGAVVSILENSIEEYRSGQIDATADSGYHTK